MWIAKNSITNETYGEKYESIYDCQIFIDKELCLLEYEMRRCFSLEKQIKKRIEDKDISLFDRIQNMVNEFNQSSGIEDITEIIAKTITTKFKNKKEMQKYIDEELEKLANTNWQKNNIIRCWYVEQKRFANGFDF